MDYNYYYGWGFFLFPVLFFLFLFGVIAWWPDRWSSRSKGTFGGDYRSGFPYYSGWELGGPWGTEYGPRKRGKGPRNYRRADDRIIEDVNDRLSMGYLDATEVSVASSDGHVTLSGSVPSRHDKRMAEALADSVAGVRDVTNQLQIGVGEKKAAA